MNPLIRTLGIAFVVILAAASTSQAQPANDLFANAWTISGASISTNGNSANAAPRETGEPNHAGNPGGRSVWFNWTAPRDAQMRIDTIGSGIDTLLGVYTGNAVNALTPVASSDNAPGLGSASLVEFIALQGVTYRIAVDVFNQIPQFPQFRPQGGPYNLNLQALASIKISSPTNGAIVYFGQPFNVDVEAEVGNPPVQRVEFYRGGSLLGSDTSDPYSFTVTGSPLGTNLITAVAVDGGGIRWTSAVTRVAVLDLGVTIVSPLTGAIYQNTNAIGVSVVASLPSGAITNVEFFADEQKFGQDATAPFTAPWNTVQGGIHRLTAIGRDNGGILYTSTPVTISIPRALVPMGSVWKYLDNGSDQGTNWILPGFNDTSWSSGPAELGYGDGDEATVVRFGDDPDLKPITTYFRRTFNLGDPADYTNLTVTIRRDDGAVLYLNGTELQRFNMPFGAVGYLTPGLTASDDGQGIYTANVPKNLLNAGNNTLAVEVHQDSASSDDLSFDLQLQGVLFPTNQPPLITLSSPANRAFFLAPSSITITATASDSDGVVARVRYFANGALLGETPGTGTGASAPYNFVWNNPPTGRHVLRAFVIDDFDTAVASQEVEIFVYDAAGTPLAQIITPPNNTVVEGPITLPIIADAGALAGLDRVEFFNNGVFIGDDAAAPYSLNWIAPFGTNLLTAVALDTGGRRGTSAVNTVTVTIPPTNTVAPTISARNPAANATIASLSTIRITFSERVQGVDASDLLVNGVPASSLTITPGTGVTPDVYLFIVTQPPAEGTVTISWNPAHGITDFGWPTVLPFNHTGPGATWNYTLVDRIAPTVLTQNPLAGATVTNLSQATVTFSESVIGVDAADFLVNGAPAFGLSGGGANYTFSFSQPPSGPVAITWAAGHGIRDLAGTPNAFNATATNATWSYTLDARTILSQSNATWRFVKGTAEASAPVTAWRAPAFNDVNWSNAPAPFYFGDPYGAAANPGTQLTDMQGNYNSIYLRRTFNVANAGPITNLLLNAQSDDGFIAWINGVEVARSANMPAGQVPYDGTTTGTANEPNGNGAAYIAYTLPNPAAYLVDGANTLAIHAFNQNLNSGDFGLNAQLYTFLSDPATVAPRITSVTPGAGTVFYFTNLTVRFSEAVTSVDAADLLINGTPATGIRNSEIGITNSQYIFTFPQPPFGPVTVTWAAGHAIVDFDSPPKPFDGASAGSTFQYTLLNPSTPTIVGQNPPAGATVDNFTQLGVTFSEAVTGVNAADLLINGAPATGLSGSGANYTFTFPRPEYGPLTISWVANHGITDLDVPPVPFDVTRQGSTWNYTHIDQTPPRIAALNPPAGAQVTNLTQVTVTFSESVAGVNATDLRVNGVPATGLQVLNATTYRFTFPQPNATVVNLTWIPTHGIRDLATVPNPFDGTGTGATWSYTTPDNVAPTAAVIDPVPFVTLRSLNSIRVTFTEPVTGVGTNDLLINDRPALSLSGGGAGPYTFSFLPPSNGVVRVRWVASHGIADLATPTPNPFGGGEWTYTLDPNASFAGKVMINEIMFNSVSGLPAEEWIELRNVSTNPVNLAGWRFSRGVRFTFPNVSLPPNGYLVAAAEVATFQAKHPEVTAVVGGWSGSLANSDETIELETAQGEIVNTVHYATEGDWARRERGHGAAHVESITRNGTTATVRIFGHGYTSGGGGGGGGGNDQILISGADQGEYNGLFTIANAGVSTFTYAVPATAVTPATGQIIARHAVDNGASGWSWFTSADGFGNSLELINPALGNASGQNWSPSANPGGTPGSPNSTVSANVAPLILEPTHFPPVPRSTDTVTITARIQDELAGGVSSVRLFYRNHTGTAPGSFASTNMFDDGAHGDGLNRDGLYGALLPAQPAGTVIEFYVQATDTSSLSRTWPAPTWETNNTFAQLANALYQVDDEAISNFMPAFRAVLSGSENAVFPWSNRNGDAEVNATFISTDGDGTKVRYLCGVRIRGAGSRNQEVPNNRLNIPNDNRWNGLQAVNLNCLYVHSQVMGAAVAQRSGLPASQARLIQYRRNGVNPSQIQAPGGGFGRGDGYGTFLMVEPVNGDLAAELFPNDGEGNVYRASTGNHSAQLVNRGTNADTYLADGYFKTSNGTENDWSDFANLTAAFAQQNVPLSDYVTQMSTNANVEMWMRYFAIGTLVCFGETSMFNGRGDDYALYRGLNDPRFVPIGHDFDTIFGQGDTTGSFTTTTNNSGTPTIFIMLNPPNNQGNAPNMPLLRRFLTNGVFAPILFGEIKRLTDTVFHPSQMGPLMDQVLTWPNGPTTLTIDAMKTFAANRRSVVLSLIPMSLTVSNSLGSSGGFPFTTTPNVTLFGTFNAIDTRKVLVNGTLANTSPWEGRWTNTVALQPGVNRVLVQTLNSNDVEFARATVDIWYDDGAAEPVSGALSADTVWSSATGPYQVTANLTVQSGVTLTILPGTTVYLSPGVNLTVANGGRILAEGTETARIRFSSAPGAGNWGGMTINGAANSPESRMAWAHFEGNGDTAIEVADGTVFLDHLSFGNPGRQYLSLDRASFVVQNCVFPATTASFEPVHGTGGIKAGGRGIVRRCFWGRIQGYNDSFDFTGGNRPGPILQVLNCVFMGSDDDLLDLDSTDAWVEGNIFLHTHRNGSPDSSSAVSGGADNADTSQITILNNLFFDVDQAANAKQGNFYTMLNNTIVHQSRNGSQDTNTAVVILADDGTVQGAGIYLEGNIIVDAENLTRNVTTALVTYTNNLFHQLAGTAWSGPGGGNVNADPLLTRIPPFSETTNFNSWAAAQVMWDYFRPRVGSPAASSGPNGRDLGAVNVGHSTLSVQRSIGAAISGEPVGTTPLTTATLRVDPLRTGNGIPTAGFANGSGFTHYKWRLDGGAWSAETPSANPIALSALGAGPHFVEVVGKNDAGFYQDDPVFGEEAVVTMSRTWTVDPTASTLRLNEILASNGGAVLHSGTRPDVIELYNAGDAALNIAGLRLTDDANNPDKFIFPVGASVPARGYLVVYANNADGTPGYHLGFTLGQEGDSVYLFAAAVNGGRLLESVSFGPQLTDLSIGRLADGQWALTQPTFGSANRAAQLGNPRALRINEWLAIAETPFNSDFIELYNGDALPVALGGLFLTDEILGWPDRHEMAALSFIAGSGYLRLIADGDANGPAGGVNADHLNFSLNGDQGAIALNAADLSLIDSVLYPGQRPNVSQGRSPNGAAAIVFFDTPTPGAPNPIVTGPPPFGGALVVNEVLAANTALAETLGTNVITPDWIELYNGTTGAIDLSNLSLSDDTQLPRKFVFAAGTQIAAGGYVRVLCADGQPVSANNTGFGLKATGGAVYLFDRPASGGSLINSILYGIQTPNLSIGRVPSGGTNWVLTSPTPNAANAAVPVLGSVANLKVNEWLANPVPGDDDWFEIFNPNTLPVALGGLHLTDDLNNRTKHRIAALSFLGTATNAYLRIHADGNTGAGADHVGFSLRADGEAVGISTTNGVLIDGRAFSFQLEGISEGRFPDGGTNVVSFPGTVSPGKPNWRQLIEVAINEVLTHTDLPLEDAIELRNLTGTAIDVGGWWLSDDEGTLQKYQIPQPTIIPANGFTVIYENVLTNAETAPIPFALSSKGDEVVLSAWANNALTGYRTRVDFGASANGVSFGRYVTSDGRAQLVAMSARTFGQDDPGSVEEFRTGAGAANVYPLVGPVVISEVMYHPPDLGTNDNSRDEFIELRNISTAPVQLFDPAHPTNTWRLRDAVDFDFPPDTTLLPGDTLLVVGFDPVNNPVALAAFRATYNLAAAVPVVGPWSGKLANDTDDIELRRPDAPEPDGDVPYYLVERVRYADIAPWPVQADGTGFSLQRLADNEFANDPANWVAEAPTPGPAASNGDTDGDGLPDSWENLYSLDPFNPNDAALDSDGDGLTNLQEYQLGTNPRDAASGLRLNIARAPGGSGLVLSFAAVANAAYAIDYADTFGSAWQPLQSFAAVGTNRVVSLSVAAGGAKRFYRLRLEGGVGPMPLRINSARMTSGGSLLLNINLPANQGCTLLFTPNLGVTAWSPVVDFTVAPQNRVMEVQVTPSGSRGFYKLRTP